MKYHENAKKRTHKEIMEFNATNQASGLCAAIARWKFCGTDYKIVKSGAERGIWYWKKGQHLYSCGQTIWQPAHWVPYWLPRQYNSAN